MKITASQLRRIIKEEVKRAKRVNLHENPTVAMVDSFVGNALTQAVKDTIVNANPDNPDAQDLLDDMEISRTIEGMVDAALAGPDFKNFLTNLSGFLSKQGLELPDEF